MELTCDQIATKNPQSKSQAASFCDNAFTQIEGVDAVIAELDTLSRAAKSEVATIAPGGAQSPERIAAAQAYDEERIFSCGIRSRSIYSTNAIRDEATLAHLRWLIERGAEVRIAPKLPIRMILIDREVAVLPAFQKKAMEGIVVHRNPGTVLALRKLFEMTWDSAVDLEPAKHYNTAKVKEKELSEKEREILRQVSLGLSYEAVGKILGVGARTIRRRVKDIKDRLGAESLQDAIHRASKSGLI